MDLSFDAHSRYEESVLSFGCGYGLELYYWSRLAHSVVGAEANADAVKTFSEKRENILDKQYRIEQEVELLKSIYKQRESYSVAMSGGSTPCTLMNTTSDGNRNTAAHARMSGASVSTTSSSTDLLIGESSAGKMSKMNGNMSVGRTTMTMSSTRGKTSAASERINSIKEYQRKLSEMTQAGRGPNVKTRSVFENIRMVHSHEVFGRKNRQRVITEAESHYTEITKVVAVDNIYHMSPKSVFFRDAADLLGRNQRRQWRAANGSLPH